MPRFYLPTRLSAAVTPRILSIVMFNLLCYISMGLPLAVIPSLVHHELGYSAVIAGFAVSLQYVATFFSRPSAGRMTDKVGSRPAVLWGLASCALSGVMLLVSGVFANAYLRGGITVTWPSLAALFVSRLLLGFAESWTATGCITWGIAALGPTRTAQVISWNGITSYGGLAIGAPLGLAMSATRGLVPLGVLSIVLCGIGLAMAAARKGLPAPNTGEVAEASPRFARILRMVAPFGSALALGSVGFGAISAFITLLYGQRQWYGTGADTPAVALSAFGVAFVVTRFVFAGQIGRRGGLRVAVLSFAVETLGLLMLWLAPAAALALLGAILAGAGFALVFPALGVEAVAKVGMQHRGSALGAYSVFLDIALGASGPVLGLLAGLAGYGAAFAAAALCAMIGMASCMIMVARTGRGGAEPTPAGR
ncbi:MFS transporter [Rhizosaccharibacter radicis]|uniref:MFS transporter n=1 Tax=Rhizosaccharibacter radicis TaxID=2782605 RepID=A0ABT1VYS0_9PROT|nr:MFS transporter [Acetobacteraceae bacterium KSS12]